ncbi:MAG: Coq4 family protein [Cyanobacteria bacterium J06600_6]
MRIKLKRLYQVFIAYRHSDNLGDFALLKADAFRVKIEPEIADKMEQIRGYTPKIDLSKLILLPESTFGREYALYLHKNKLKPLQITPELIDLGQDNLFALRYAVTHDMFHVLLDFDTSYAGEIGVLAFAVAQKYSKLQNISLAIAKICYPLLAPRQIKAILTNLERGKLMGQQARFLLNYRFEDCWSQPLDSLRQELGIRLNY